MSVVGLLAGIGAVFKVRYLNDKAVVDNPVFRLHYRLTSALFFAFCVLTTAFNLFGKPIDCIISDGFSRPDMFITYCWIQSTFTIAGSQAQQKVGQVFAHPGVGAEASGHEKRYHSYYQWVPFILFLQGVLFYLPHWLWKLYEGGRIRNLTDGSRGQKIGAEGERKTHCSALFRYLVETMRCHRNLIHVHVMCEILNFVNVVGNIYFINRFLNGVFLDYGTRVLGLSNEDQEERNDPMIEIFPRMTKCNLNYYGSSGTIQKVDALCLLPLNIVNEKIYIFLWFWLIFLAVVSGLALVYRIFFLQFPALRLFLIRRLASPSLDSSKMVVQRVPIGDYFVLHMLGKNLDGFLFNGLIDDMAVHLSNTIPAKETREPNRFVRQTSKLSELMATVGQRASFKGDSSSAKTNYFQMEESPVTKHVDT